MTDEKLRDVAIDTYRSLYPYLLYRRINLIHFEVARSGHTI